MGAEHNVNALNLTCISESINDVIWEMEIRKRV